MNRRLFTLLAILLAMTGGMAGYLAGTGSSSSAAEAEVPVAPMETAPEGQAPGPMKPGAMAPALDEVLSGELSDDQRAEVEAIIRGYLLAHPEIVRDALTELQRRQDAAEQMAQVKAISDNKDLLFSSNRQVVLGNPDGDVTLVEFFDYNCTYCRRAHGDMKQLLASDQNLRVVLKEFPVLGEGSVEAAQVGVALNIVAPDKYFAFHDALLSERGQINGERALAVAEEIGVDVDKLKAEMQSDEVRATIAEVYDLASRLSLSGTPSYVTPREVVVGAVGLDMLQEKIKGARDCAQANC